MGVVDGDVGHVFGFNPAFVKGVRTVRYQIVVADGNAGSAVAPAVDADDGFVQCAVQFEFVVADRVGFGIAQHLDGFHRAVGFGDGDVVAGYVDIAAQAAVVVFFLNVNRHRTVWNFFDRQIVAGDVDVARTRTFVFGGRILRAVDHRNQVARGITFDGVIADIDGVVDGLLVVAHFDAVCLQCGAVGAVVCIQRQAFNRVAVDDVRSIVFGMEVFILRIGLQLDSRIAVVVGGQIVVHRQAEFRILRDDVIGDFDVVHCKLAVVDTDTV